MAGGAESPYAHSVRRDHTPEAAESTTVPRRAPLLGRWPIVLTLLGVIVISGLLWLGLFRSGEAIFRLLS